MSGRCPGGAQQALIKIIRDYGVVSHSALVARESNLDLRRTVEKRKAKLSCQPICKNAGVLP
jgi:hypothetical protein